MNRRILLGALAVGAFVVTLAFSSWHQGLWPFAAEPASVAAPHASQLGALSGTAASPRANALPETTTSTPNAPAAAPAAVIPPPAIEPTEVPQGQPLYDQVPNPGVDSEAVRRDHGVQHSSGPP